MSHKINILGNGIKIEISIQLLNINKKKIFLFKLNMWNEKQLPLLRLSIER